jgi:hypothetical protein
LWDFIRDEKRGWDFGEDVLAVWELSQVYETYGLSGLLVKVNPTL